ncbi:heme-binding protein 2 [Hyalella azteca]|uniref:Heme-binding protein 2 n=1 Tax=Hyalella azteca TaxID=294128 RepID=A0A8B7P0X6_HYAAZ|nr:heme-binding protein 2 [Hyalella azteca]
MRVLFHVAVLGCVVASAAAQFSWINNVIDGVASIFQTYEEAPHTVVRTFQAGFEERQYPARKWVCTDHVAPRGDSSMSDPFFKLFRYISGANAAELKIDMTVPVTSKKRPQGTNSVVTTMCFFIGESHQASVPAPTEAEVYIENRPQITIFTRRIGGWPDDADYARESQTLRAMVQAEGIAVLPDDQYYTGYNSPMDFWNRRNELWLIKA